MEVLQVTHQLDFLPVTPGFCMLVFAQMNVFITEVLFFCEPPMSPIGGGEASDIGQVSMAKSSIHFKYFYLLKISMEYFPFARRSP